MALTEITGRRKRKLLTAHRKAEALRDQGKGSYWSNLVRLVGVREARVMMMNLEWNDPSFMPPLNK